DAGRAYDRVWRAWLREQGSPEPEMEVNLDGTLAMGDGTPCSPINRGLMVVHNTVFKRAVALSGDAATETDGEDTWLVDPWRGAPTALTDVALALGAPDLVAGADRPLLIRAWATLGIAP